jgi:hypothetical protein
MLSTATIMGSCPSALEVAANYDGAGKVIVITGVNSGIGELIFDFKLPNFYVDIQFLIPGKETARVLAIRCVSHSAVPASAIIIQFLGGCTVVMCVWDKSRGLEAAAEIVADVPEAKLNVMVRAATIFSSLHRHHVTFCRFAMWAT